MEEQKCVLEEIDSLHSSISQVEYDERYAQMSDRWRLQFPDFEQYFRMQWHNTVFDQWKVFNSAPGVVNTNNAVESFNATLKRIYTNHSRHTLPALVDIILKRLLPDLAMHIYTREKAFSLKRRPDSKTYAKVSAITPDKYNIVTTGLVMRFFKRDDATQCYVADAQNSSCSCKGFAKKGYCKHILFVLKKFNRDSATIVVERTFAYRGNTRRTRQMRGRVADAVPALQRNT